MHWDREFTRSFRDIRFRLIRERLNSFLYLNLYFSVGFRYGW
jgi:hypothetical protein